MEVDAAQFKHLTPEECQQYIKEGRCFKCRKQGHLARDCPTHKSDEQKSDKKSISTAKIETPKPKKESSEERIQRLINELQSLDDAIKDRVLGEAFKPKEGEEAEEKDF